MLALLQTLPFAVSAATSGTCNGPLQPTLKFGCQGHRDVANHICCHNTAYAEHFGFLRDPDIKLFSKLTDDGTTTFYDSVCGIPLFIAPKGRTHAEWKKESFHHGWPSFRPEEAVKSNIVFHPGGEMASTCGTHLGHNLPDATGDRYCIDLVCIAGEQGGAASSGVVEHPHLRTVLHHKHSQQRVWFGDGCFWATQKAMVAEELKLGRNDKAITSLAGYAGSLKEGGAVCYYGAGKHTYATLGFAEAVSVALDPKHSHKQFKRLVMKYFSLFQSSPGGGKAINRPDQFGDAGTPYRSSIGIPGGVNGALFTYVKQANTDTDGGKLLTLKKGTGGDDDTVGVVWIYDSDRFVFHRAEKYHQFYDQGLGPLKAVQSRLGNIDPVPGCKERGD